MIKLVCVIVMGICTIVIYGSTLWRDHQIEKAYRSAEVDQTLRPFYVNINGVRRMVTKEEHDKILKELYG